jgi:hypothetical protein
MSVTSSTSYAANLYATRQQEGLFPFQMHFSTPVSFPLENYYLPSPYYPHLTESLNLKFTQGIYKPHLLTPSSYDMEKMLTNKANEPMEKSTKEKENEVTSSEEIPTVSDRLRSTQSLYDSATKLLFLSIRWAKSIPSFNQLTMADQKRLLNDSWAELFVIAASQWSFSIDDEIISTFPHLKILQNVIKHFVSLKIDHFEAACLKALILFRGDASEDQQSTTQQIFLLQNQTLCLLIEKCGGLRFGHLLLLLPQIRIAGNAQNLQVRKIIW